MQSVVLSSLSVEIIMKAAILALLFLLPFTLFSQDLKSDFNQITGMVLDDSLNSPLPGALVAAIGKDHKVIAGTTSDVYGNFLLKGLFSSPQLRITLIGYKEYYVDSIVFNEGKADLGVIRLKHLSLITKEIVVKGEKPLIEYFIDKQVINLDKVQGGNGTIADALQKVGVVTVDPSTKKISIRGSENVRVLLDGKPMPMGDDFLSQMPASSTEKVELSTTPSAKYDAEGEAGILNIIQKHNLGDYLNGSIYLSSGSQGNSYGNALLNFKKQNYNIFLSLSGSAFENRFMSTGKMTSYNAYSPFSENSSTRTTGDGRSRGIYSGIDYAFNAENAASLTLSYSGSGNQMANHGSSSDYSLSGVPAYSFDLNSDQNNEFNTWSVTGFYRRKINATGTEVTTDIYLSHLRQGNPMETKLLYNYAEAPFLEHSQTDTKNYTFIINSDYVNPILNSGKFEAGYKYTWRNRSSAYDVLNYDNTQQVWRDTGSFSNLFKYTEGIVAAYSTWADKMGDFEYKVGLRIEYTDIKGFSETTGVGFRHNYVDWFPTVNISYSFNPFLQIVLSATRRITRPRMENVNPFIRFGGAHSEWGGNPDLKPMYVDRYELTLNPFITIYHSNSNGNPRRISLGLSNGRMFSTLVNLSRVRSFGADFSLPLSNGPTSPITFPDWWNYGNISVSYQKVSEQGGFNYSSASESYTIYTDVWSINAFAGIKTYMDCQLTVGCRYAPKHSDSRYVTFSTTNLYMSVSRDFFDRKLSVSVSGNNLLNSDKNKQTTYGSNYYSYSEFLVDRSRNVSVGINWKFNDFKFRRDRKVDDGRDGVSSN